jgi:hypothetical protein
MKKVVKKAKAKPVEEPGEKKVKVSHKFVTALAIVSMLGFAGIISQTIFNYDLSFYVESFLMLIIGLALIVESKFKKLKSLERGITSNNLTHLTTIVIGTIAILAGIFSFPQIRVTTAGFLAIKGIIAIIAIIVIGVQTWVID